jgi:radical SAM protein with 4Fe4S-binding SPASM domain
MALGRPFIGPQEVSLEVTHDCNLRCSFCESHGALQAKPITSRREYAGGRRTMDLDTIRRLAGDLARLGTDMVELSGRGDPIAHPRLGEIVQIVKTAGLRCALVTNGTLAKPDLVAAIAEGALDRLNVSLNAGTADVYRRTNGRDLFDKAIRFLTDVLQGRKDRVSSRPWVRVSHVVCKENIEDMDNMVRVVCELGVDEVVWYVMGTLPETTHLHLGQDEVDLIARRAPEWKARLENAGVATNLESFVDALEAHRGRNGEPQSNPLQRDVPCYEGWRFAVIQPDGVVIPCCYCEEERLGNVFETSFIDVWRGEAYQSFRERSLSMPRTGRWICSECFTSCNRASENRRLYGRLHPLRKVKDPHPPA